jgi:thermitase
MHRIRTAAGAVASLLVMAGTASAADAPPLDVPRAPAEVIVHYEKGASASMRAAARDAVDSSSARRLLIPDTQVLRVPHGTARAASRELERLGSVVWAEPNRIVKGGAAATNDPYFGDLWGLDNTGQTVDGHTGTAGVDVNALSAWDTTRGAGTVVAVVDSGVAGDHPDIHDAIWTNKDEVPDNGVDDDQNGLVDDVHGYDFWDWDNTPDDFHGHGSHVAGTIAARGNNNTGIVGVAPEATVMPVRVLNDSNRGRTSDIANGIAYAALNGADVINLSLGTRPEDAPPPEIERDAIDLAAKLDAVVVVAAMNDSQNNDTGHSPVWPCNLPEANLVCVAAIDSDGGLSSFSNYGAQSVDVGAPGRSIFSLSPDWFRLTPPGIEDFESGISTRWYGPAGGWAGTTAFAASGSWSLTDSPNGNYADDGTAWAAMTNGVDLTGQRGCRINYEVKGKVLDGDNFVTGMLDHLGGGHVALAESLDTNGRFETHSDGIAALDGDPDVHAVLELLADSSGTADGVYVDDLRFICRASDYDADSYYFNEGTSMATPHVSGVAALVRSAVPDATAGEVAQAIREGAVSLPSLAGKTVTGGRADAPRAIAAARRLADRPPASPPPSDPGNPGDPGPPAGDGSAPVARLDRATLRRHVLVLRFSFPNEAGPVSGTVRVGKASGTIRYRARAGRPAVVRMHLRGRARRTVVTISARDSVGNASVTKRRVKFRAP